MALFLGNTRPYTGKAPKREVPACDIIVSFIQLPILLLFFLLYSRGSTEELTED